MHYLFVLSLFLLCCVAKKPPSNCHFSCGQIHNISYPFGLKGHKFPRNCSPEPSFLELECDEKNNTILFLDSVKQYVLAINYDNRTIRMVDAGLLNGTNNCSSIPFLSFTNNYKYYYDSIYHSFPQLATVLYLCCENPVDSPHYIDPIPRPCIHGGVNVSSAKTQKSYSYVLLGNVGVSEIAESCSVDKVVKSSSPTIYTKNLSYADIHSHLLYGFELNYDLSDVQCGFGCTPFGYMIGYIYTGVYYAPLLIAMKMIAERILFGVPLVMIFLIYKWRRRHLSMFDTVENFLRNQNNLMPIKYSYFEIKKMTKGFKNKLGEGGYGSVYKGKLRSERVVAVKILGKSKCNGQEFINEVATIGRIHHANIVQLIGFCAERSNRALVYEFMTNGSLEKYIFSKESNTSLSVKKMYEISIGVARGIDYLHRGCDMQILHFDIKPHNILLDENFTSKVSDFGLAKLYPTEDSIVSLTAARGTMGYMAPELCYKNIGGISYKADVYSFGMLLMEMASRRKNLNVYAEHSSQIYFPSWVFEQLSLGDEIEIGETTDEEKKILKKMLIVSLWCIQMKPSGRPSMNKVVEMLENEVEHLQMPPKPFLSLKETSREDEKIDKRSSETSDALSDDETN